LGVALFHVDGQNHGYDENKIRFSQMLFESAYKLEVCAKYNNTGALALLLYLDFRLVNAHVYDLKQKTDKC
jgi:hypothetical protein